MVYKFQCDLAKQDCAQLYPSTSSKLAFTSTSCVRDARLPGTVGRCGFPGAPCSVDGNGNDNCAGGGDSTSFNQFGSICRNGFCEGAAGALCGSNVQCNWGMTCNVSASAPGVCGGFNALMNNAESADGLDFKSDYCLSGKAFQDAQGHWLCDLGPPMQLTSPTVPVVIAHKKLNVGLIAGVTAGGVVVVVTAILAFLRWRKRPSKRAQQKRPMILESIGSDVRTPSMDMDEKRDLSHVVEHYDHDDPIPPSATSFSFPWTNTPGTSYIGGPPGLQDDWAYHEPEAHMLSFLPEIENDASSSKPSSSMRPVQKPLVLPSWQLSDPSPTSTGDTPVSAARHSPTLKVGENPLLRMYPATVANIISGNAARSAAAAANSDLPSDHSPLSGPSPTDQSFMSQAPDGLPETSDHDKDVDVAERRLLALRAEAERGLAEIRARRELTGDDS